MRALVPWFGGKGNMTAKLLPLLPAHKIYVEPFGGGASLLFAKRPAAVEVYNDLHSGLVNLYRVVRDPELFERFALLVSLTPYAREEFEYCRDHWQLQTDPVERARQFYFVARASFSGKFAVGNFSTAVTASNRGMVMTCSKYLTAIARLPEIHARLQRVQIEQQDFTTILERYDTPETLFYCDPPYVHDTRRDGSYEHEMRDADHERLVAMLLKLQGHAVLSAYASPLYAPLEAAGWRRVDFNTACYAAARTKASGILGEGAALATQARVETVYMSQNTNELPLFATGVGE